MSRAGYWDGEVFGCYPDELMVKYLIYPGVVRSPVDGDLHYVSATELASLYGVDYSECRVHDVYTRLPPDQQNLPILVPRANGKYDLDQLVNEAKQKYRENR